MNGRPLRIIVVQNLPHNLRGDIGVPQELL
jgi:hypothetical protein